MLMAKQWVFLRIGRTNLCGKHKYTIQLYPFLQKEQMLEDGFTFPIRIRYKKHYQHKYEKNDCDNGDTSTYQHRRNRTDDVSRTFSERSSIRSKL